MVIGIFLPRALYDNSNLLLHLHVLCSDTVHFREASIDSSRVTTKPPMPLIDEHMACTRCNKLHNIFAGELASFIRHSNNPSLAHALDY